MVVLTNSIVFHHHRIRFKNSRWIWIGWFSTWTPIRFKYRGASFWDSWTKVDRVKPSEGARFRIFYMSWKKLLLNVDNFWPFTERENSLRRLDVNGSTGWSRAESFTESDGAHWPRERWLKPGWDTGRISGFHSSIFCSMCVFRIAFFNCFINYNSNVTAITLHFLKCINKINISH